MPADSHRIQNFPESLTTHRTSGAVDKQYIIIPSMHQAARATPHDTAPNAFFRRSAERNDPLLFIAAGDVAHHKVDILYLQMDQLTDADTGRIQHFQHCFVADPLACRFGLASSRSTSAMERISGIFRSTLGGCSAFDGSDTIFPS